MSEFVSRVREYIDVHRVGLRKAAGIITTLLAVLIFVGSLTYLFTWKEDQSVLQSPNMMGDAAQSVSNSGGKFGLKLADLLVSRCFGLGTAAIVVALAVISMRLLLGKRKFSVLKYVILSLTGAMLSSFVLAFISLRLGLENAFNGGGLGGSCGSQTVQWLETMFGMTVTFLFLVALCLVWIYFASKRFNGWVENGSVQPQDAKKPRTFNFGPKSSDQAVVKIKLENESSEVNGNTLENSAEDEWKGRVDVERSGMEFSQSIESQTNDSATPVAEGEISVAAGAMSQPVAQDVEPVAEGGTSESVDAGVPEIIQGTDLTTDVTELPRIEVRDELPDYQFPSLSLLKDYTDSVHNVSSEELKRNNFKIRATLQTFHISVEDVKAVVGPTVTLYKVYLADGVRIQSVVKLHREIAMALNTDQVRVVMLPDSVGIEVPNDRPSIVPLKALLNDAEFRNSKAELPIAIGYTVTKKVKVFDLADAPHLLVAGATKQGKSVGLNVMIASLLYSKHPSELKFVFIDPKMVEFGAYSRLLHHYLAVLPNSGDAKEEMDNAIVKKAANAEMILRSLCIEMDSRYDLMNKAGVNNVVLYNDKYRDRHLLPTEGHHYMPYVVTVIDEYSDLIMSAGSTGDDKSRARSITTSIVRLAQKGRAAGIHVIIATQRPSVDVITGLIKTNFPTRIAFRVFSGVDSKTILDSTGAEKLIGKGDMIYNSGANIERVQCALIDNSEISALTKSIGSQIGYHKSYNTPYYLPDPADKADESGSNSVNFNDLDERFEEAARMIVASQKGSTSDLQRRLGMGYARSGRVMDQLESAGIVGPQDGSKPRQVLIADMDELDLKLKELRASSN